jgi:hypothetical protein
LPRRPQEFRSAANRGRIASGLKNGVKAIYKKATGSGGAPDLGPLVTGGGSPGTIIQGPNFTISGTRKINQIRTRGWTNQIIDNTISAPYTTRAATNKATLGSATAYYRQSGVYVVLDDATGAVVQLSNRKNPAAWTPDPTIVSPFRPGG